MYRLIMFFLLVLNLLACSLGGGAVPQDHFYRLAEVVLDSRSAIYSNIVIKPVKSTGLYHERAILFIESDKPLELQRYHYSFWSTAPADLVHNALYQGLQSSGISTQISRDISDIRPDYIIDTRIIHFERCMEAHKITVEVGIEVSARNATTGAVWIKRYHVSKIVTTDDMHTSAEAFGEALKDITQQLVDDLLASKK